MRVKIFWITLIVVTVFISGILYLITPKSSEKPIFVPEFSKQKELDALTQKSVGVGLTEEEGVIYSKLLEEQKKSNDDQLRIYLKNQEGGIKGSD